MDKQRDALADALYKKGLALVQLEEDQKIPQVFHLRNEMLCNLFFSDLIRSKSFIKQSLKIQN